MRLEVDDQLSLRSPERADAGALFRAVDGDRPHLSRWLPWVVHNHEVADTASFIERSRAQEEAGTGIALLIEAPDGLLGVVGFNSIDRDHRSSEIGYWLRSAAEGRGVMTRAVAALVDHAFGALELNRLGIRAEPDNRRSRAVAERLGFREEGTLREVELHNGRFVDLVCYSLLRREHEARRPAPDGGRGRTPAP
jgi:ribosomal-protein-serine acetyltransferase